MSKIISTPRGASQAKANRDGSPAPARRLVDRKQSPLHRAIQEQSLGELLGLDQDAQAPSWLCLPDKFGATPMELATTGESSEIFEHVAGMHKRALRADSGATRKQRQSARKAISHALSKAVVKGDASRVRALIGMGADVDLALPDENPPLLLAAYWGRLDCLEELIGAGADLEASDGIGNGALSMAAASPALECLRCLIWAGASIERANLHGQTALWMATDACDLGCMGALIASGANVQARARRGATPSMAASMIGSLDALTLLREAGADVHAEDDDGYQCLNYALMHEREECVDYLLDHGAKARAKNSKGKSCLALAREHGVERFWLEAHSKWRNKDLVARELKALAKAAKAPSKTADKESSKRL